MTPKETPTKKTTGRKWLRRVLITLAVIILLPIGLFTIGWLNRDTIINELQDWYSENNTGTLTIEKVNTSFLSGFPNVGFTLKNITQVNFDTITDISSKIHVDEVKLTIDASKLLKGTIEVKNMVITGADIHSEVISKRSLEYHQQLKITKNAEKKAGFEIPDWLSKKRVSFAMYDVTYIVKDTMFHKNFNFDISKIKGSYKGNGLKLSGNLSFDATLNDLGFNTTRGSFSNGARLKGTFNFDTNLDAFTIDVKEFPLAIDEQTFLLNAKFNLSEANTYHLEFKNETTDFEATKSLLTDSLADKVKNYDILEPFKSRVTLVGTFDYGNNPNIFAEFSTESNNIIIADQYNLTNVSFKGYLSTDIYQTDSLRSAKKSSKDIKVAFDFITAELDDIHIDISKSYYQSTPDALNYLETTVNLRGSNETLATVLEMDNFDFKGGSFLLDAAMSGDISDPNEFLDEATGHFRMDNTQVSLKKNGLQLPIQTIDLALDKQNSVLRELIINLPNNDYLILKGTLKNVSGLLTQSAKTSTTSEIYLDSKSLNINEIIEMAKKFVPKSQANINDRKTLYETLQTLYNRFHPQFNFSAQSLHFDDVTINQVSSSLALSDAETILLRNFQFNYFDVVTVLEGNVKVFEPVGALKDVVFIDAKATSSGSINVFQDLFDIQLFRIDSGTFEFNGIINGNLKRFSELLNTAKGDLKLSDTKLFYEAAEMEINIDSLALFVDDSDIFLNRFNVEIDDLNPINLSGTVTQFPTFLLDSKKNTGSVTLNIDSDYIDGDRLLTRINSLKMNDKSDEPTFRKSLHRVFEDINKFNPQIELSIDSLKYKDLITQNVKSSVFFENDSILKLNNLDLQYKETTVNILGEINAHYQQENSINDNPFDFIFSVFVKGKAEDLNDYLKTKNFIFKSGDYSFVGNYKGQSRNLESLNSNAFGDLKIGNALLDYRVAGLQIPVDSLHVEINDDVAELKALDINLPGKSSIYFSGSIDNFSDFINDSEFDTGHSSDFSIYAPYLDSRDIIEFLKNTKSNKDTISNDALDLQKFKEAMVKINNSFYPTVDFKIDTLKHHNLNAKNFKMALLFDADGNFKIHDSALDFVNGSIALNVDVGVRTEAYIPVKIDMEAKNIDLNELVTQFDFFNNEALRETERIDGIVNYILKADGTVANDGVVNLESLNGTLQIELDSLKLINYAPLMESTPLMKDERFKNLRFRSIVQTFEIKDGVVIIPRTEIQSSAIQVFIEGQVKFNEYINVWLSLPWKNLKSNDGLTLPEKTTFGQAGSKFFLELVQDKNAKKERNQNLKVKFRFSDRKLKKEQSK